MKRILFLFLLYVLSFDIGYSQNILHAYIDEGINNNLNARQLSTNYEQALWGLKEAKRLYAPSVDFVASYGHLFRKPYDLDLDASDPVVSGLLDFINTLDISSIKDGRIYYPAPNQYNAGIQISQTIYNKELAYNKQMKEAGIRSARAQLDDFKTELEAEIQSAYYTYLQAHFVKECVNQSLALTRKNLQGIESLIAQQKITKEVLYKARANTSNREAQLRNAENKETKARNYFNFLLNRLPDSYIELDTTLVYDQSVKYVLSKGTIANENNEYNLTHIQGMIDYTVAQQYMIRANNLPKIQFGALAAYKGRSIDFERDQNYIGQVQISLKWNLFNSGTNKAKSRQTMSRLKGLKLQYEQQQNQLALNEINSLNDVTTELENYSSVTDSYNNASVYYSVVEQKFGQGMASILELTDAEEQLLQSEVNNYTWYYQLLIKTANYQKKTGKTIKIISIK